MNMHIFMNIFGNRSIKQPRDLLLCAIEILLLTYLRRCRAVKIPVRQVRQHT